MTFAVLKLFCAHSVFLTPRDWGTDVKEPLGKDLSGQDVSTLEPACVGSWLMIWEVAKVQAQSNGGKRCSVYSDWVQRCQHVSLNFYQWTWAQSVLASQSFPCWNGGRVKCSNQISPAASYSCPKQFPISTSHSPHTLWVLPLTWCIYLHKDRDVEEKQSVLYHRCFRMRNILI